MTIDELKVYMKESKYIRKAEESAVGKWFLKLSPGWKIGTAFGAAVLGLSLARAVKRAIYSPEGYPPPPAYRGAYGKIEGMRHAGFAGNRSSYSDFGSGVLHARMMTRNILPGRHVNHFMRRFGK